MASMYFHKLDQLDGIHDCPLPLYNGHPRNVLPLPLPIPGNPIAHEGALLTCQEFEKIFEIDHAITNANLCIEQCRQKVNTYKSYMINTLVEMDGIEQLATLRQEGVI